MRSALWARVMVRFPVWSRMRTRVGTTRGGVSPDDAVGAFVQSPGVAIYSGSALTTSTARAVSDSAIACSLPAATSHARMRAARPGRQLICSG
ncbi:hypothetical protein Pd630_LPD01239 [Rhodococcus opacus PD630]|nr:hypothetical protein Pd630_LPD01239 [Rhodococcus opacus PD630]